MADDLTNDAPSAVADAGATGAGTNGTLLTDDSPAAADGAEKPGTAGTGGRGGTAGADPANPANPAGTEKAPAELEPFELAAPEGYPMGESELKSVTDMARAARMDKTQAEAVLKYMAGNYTAFQEEQVQSRKAWIEEFRADKEFGGDKFTASVADGQKALDTFDPEKKISAMLRSTGYGDNAEVLRIFARVGAALGQDKLIGTGSDGGAEKPLEERLYPNMK